MGQSRDKWKALVNNVMNLWVPWNVWNFLSSYQVEIQSRITSEIDQQSWYQVAAYNTVKQICNLKLHESLHGNVTSVHLCGLWSHCYKHMRGLKMLKVSVMTQWMFVTTTDSLYHCYFRNWPFRYINLTCWEFPVLPFSGNCHYRPTGTFIMSPISFLAEKGGLSYLHAVCVCPSWSTEPVMWHAWERERKYLQICNWKS
jgi:hypothetical protein